jgi:abortive infection bacteriophage resistance protein
MVLQKYPPTQCAHAYPQIGGSFYATPIVMSPFVKPAISYDEQVALLQSRGMFIDNAAKAVTTLRHVNCDRLRAYWAPFEVSKDAHHFRKGTTFDDIVALCTFDRNLRLLVFVAIERVEVSMRAVWAHNLAHEYGPFGYCKPEHFKPRKTMARCTLRT